MKNYQFYTILIVIIIGFIILYFKIDNVNKIHGIDLKDYIWNIDNNVVNVDEFLHRKLDQVYFD